MAKKAKIAMAAGGAVACVALAGPASAQGGGPVTLDAVTVTADRRVETPVNNIPGAVTVLEGEDLQRRLDAARDVEEVLLDTVPGYNDETFPTIRGRRALVLINGAPQNETLRESSGFDVENVDPDAIERIEVSRGATALYGYGAPGGVINIVTRRATSRELEVTSKAGLRFNPSAPGPSLEANTYHSAGQKLGRFDYRVGLGYERDRLPFDADGERIPDYTGDTHDYSADVALGYDVTDDSELVFRSTYQRRDLDRSWSAAGGVYPTTPNRARHDAFADDGYVQDQTYNLTFSDEDLAGGTGLKLEAYLHDHYDTENQIFGASVVDDRLQKDTLGIRSTLSTPLDGLLTDGSKVVYGLDYVRDHFDRPAVDLATGRIATYFAPESWLDTYAAYAQLEVPVGDWLLSGGLRREEYRGRTADTSAFPGGVTGGKVKGEGLTLLNVGAVYFIDDELDVYGSISQGTNITQLGRAARSATRVEQIRLEADPSTQYEVGFRGSFRDWDFTTAAFFTESEKGVTLVPDPVAPLTSPLIVRREPRKTWGFEATAGYRFDETLKVGGNLTWQEGIVDAGNTGDWARLGSRDISPLRLVGNVDYDPLPWWSNRFQVSYRAGRDAFPEASTAFGEGNVDPIFLLDYFASFDVDPGVVRFGVQNLLNEDHYSQVSQADQLDSTFVKAPGTTVSLSYAIRW
jgi:iron complex outermembrane receptor protein